MPFALTLTEHENHAVTEVFDQDEVTVGRSSTNHFRTDPFRFSQVSRSHARILRRSPEHFVYEDLGSTQGSYVAGREITSPFRVESGTLITLGSGGPQLTVSWPECRLTGKSATHYQHRDYRTPSFPLAFSPSLDGQFRRFEKIGTGGFGDVWKAIPELDKMPCRAIKLVHPFLLDPEMLGPEDRQSLARRFAREAQITHRLSQSGTPGIIPVYSWGDDPARDYLFIVMDYVEGDTLDRVIRSKGPLEFGLVARLFRQVAQALAAAHKFEFENSQGIRCRGVIHRDIKPSNILVDLSRETAWVMDFGVAGLLEGGDRLTATNVPVGTRLYLPPEVGETGAIDPGTDLWGFAMTLYLALSSGYFPYDCDEDTLGQQRILPGAMIPITRFRTALPEELVSALHRSLSIDPSKRLYTAQQWITLLQRYESS